MFKLIQMFQAATRSLKPAQNYFSTFAVEMPPALLPILQNRLTFILVNNLYGVTPYAGITTQELLDIDLLLCRYYFNEAHNMLLDGRQLSLLKRFVESERDIIIRSRFQVVSTEGNPDPWWLMTDLIRSLKSPTEVISLSFFGIA